MSDLLTYAYAVVRNAEGLREATAPLRGVADSPVSLVTDSGDDQLGLVVSHVPGQDFQEDALKQHLEDLEWLEAVARAHHGVIEALGERTTVLPLRLATVYLDDNRAREMLEAGRTMFAERLALLSEHVEWGVKIYVESATALTEPTVPAAELTPGRAYLRNRFYNSKVFATPCTRRRRKPPSGWRPRAASTPPTASAIAYSKVFSPTR